MQREELRTRRPSLNFAFSRGAVPFTGCVGFGPDRKPLEVFLSCLKTAEIEALGRDAAILISLVLQHGGSFDTMRHAITRDHAGVASTLIGQLLDEIEGLTAADVAMVFGGDAVTQDLSARSPPAPTSPLPL